MTGHLRLNFDRVEDLAVVDTDDATNHFRDDDHVTEVGLDNRGFLIWRCLFLGFTKFLDEAHGLALQTALETSTSTGMDELNELLIAQIQKFIELNPTVGEGTEGSLLLEVGSDLGVSNGGISHLVLSARVFSNAV